MKFKRTQLATMAALVGLGLLNPFSVAILDEWFKWAYTGISVVCAVWICSFLLYKVFRVEKTNIPVVRSKRAQARD